MKEAYLMIGLPGSGKSTAMKEIAAKCAENGKSFGYFSLDTARLGFYGGYHAPVVEGETKADTYRKAFDYCNTFSKEFDQYVNELWHHVLAKNDVVVVDNTHMTRKSRTRWVQDLRSAKKGGPFKIIALNIMVPVELAIQRQSTRGDKYVPEQVIRDMHMRYQEVLIPDEADLLINKYGF